MLRMTVVTNKLLPLPNPFQTIRRININKTLHLYTTDSFFRTEKDQITGLLLSYKTKF